MKHLSQCPQKGGRSLSGPLVWRSVTPLISLSSNVCRELTGQRRWNMPYGIVGILVIIILVIIVLQLL
jgi:hypothetical protein